MATPVGSTTATGTSGISGNEPWFRALRPTNLKTSWGELVDSYTKSNSLKEWGPVAKGHIKDFWKNTTAVEKAIISEPLTMPLGPWGDIIQAKWMAGIDIKNLPGAQRAAVGAVKYGLPVLVGLGLARLAYKTFKRKDDYPVPPRYKEAYSRLHRMDHGQPFFGSGANLDAIVAFGRKTMPKTMPLHRPIRINPSRGGLVQELGRTANTHHLIGSANTEFNARLFNTVV
jgi:hypothetical protein